jgi:hypothetical protein
MYNRSLYEPFNDEQLYKIVHNGYYEFHEALLHEIKHGTDKAIAVALLHESIASILLMDREELLDRIGIMDKYTYKLNKYNEENDKEDSSLS